MHLVNTVTSAFDVRVITSVQSNIICFRYQYLGQAFRSLLYSTCVCPLGDGEGGVF